MHQSRSRCELCILDLHKSDKTVGIAGHRNASVSCAALSNCDPGKQQFQSSPTASFSTEPKKARTGGPG
jgi:hypothetical protein